MKEAKGKQKGGTQLAKFIDTLQALVFINLISKNCKISQKSLH